MKDDYIYLGLFLVAIGYCSYCFTGLFFAILELIK